MHTFFINASSERIETYQALVEMELEKRTLVMLNLFDENEADAAGFGKTGTNSRTLPYFIKDWYRDSAVRGANGKNVKRNYRAYAEKIAEIIDSDKEIGDQYNLIVYVDLMDFDDYKKAVSEAKSNLMQLYHCRRTFCRLVRAFVCKTLLEALDDFAYEPNEALLILDTGWDPINAGGAQDSYDLQHSLFGLDDAFFEKDFSEEAFEKAFLSEKSKQAFWQGIRDIYREPLKTHLKAV
ncbi:MAG: hypothetical protein IKD07_05850, partial [Clostridia bacterium]|nr:hypothetical protein [Clostridia bacterium]